MWYPEKQCSLPNFYPEVRDPQPPSCSSTINALVVGRDIAVVLLLTEKEKVVRWYHSVRIPVQYASLIEPEIKQRVCLGRPLRRLRILRAVREPGPFGIRQSVDSCLLGVLIQHPLQAEW